METKLFIINNISNLHVGSGDTNYGVIDNLVQKDVNTNLPTINSSGVKGAFRQFYDHFNKDKTQIEHIFGSKSNASKPKQGHWNFLSADLLSRPVRSDKIAYLNATSAQSLKQFLNKAKKLKFQSDIINQLEKLSKIEVSKNSPKVFNQSLDGAKIEEPDWTATYVQTDINFELVKQVLGENIVLVNNEDFRTQLTLPVIARNHLENGKSQNLWYEEVVPYDSYFGIFIIHDKDYFTNFVDTINNENYVQFGGNASIGYGLCEVKQF